MSHPSLSRNLFSAVDDMSPETRALFTPANPRAVSPDAICAARELIFESKINGRRVSPASGAAFLEAAMASPDFANVLSTDIATTVIELYNAAPPALERLCRRSTLPNFNSALITSIRGGTKPMAQVNPETGGFLQDKKTDASHGSRQLRSYGKTFSLPWSTRLADIRDAFRNLPRDVAQSAVNTREDVIARAMFTTSGWNLTTKQGSVSTNALTITNLATAYTELCAYTDLDGLPIGLKPVYLAHSPALTFTVDSILNSSEIRDTTATTRYGVANVVNRRNLIPIEAFWPNTIITAGTVKSTWWGLFVDPMDIPAVWVDDLEGHEGPQIFYRAPELQAVGGGLVPNRSWANDSMDIRGQIHTGAVAVTETDGTRACWLSNGG